MNDKAYFIIEVKKNAIARILRVSDDDYEILNAQIEIGAAPALRWNIRTAFETIPIAIERLQNWINEWIEIQGKE